MNFSEEPFDEYALDILFDELRLCVKKPLSFSAYEFDWKHLTSGSGFSLDCENVLKERRPEPTFVPELPIVDSLSKELTESLKFHYERNMSSNEASSRLLVDLILKEALKLSGSSPKIKLGVEEHINFEGLPENDILISHSGSADYCIGSSPKQDSLLFAVEAKPKEDLKRHELRIFDKALIQAIGYTASISKERRRKFKHFLDGKEKVETPVFGAVTSGENWYFFAVDNDVVYSGGNIIEIGFDKNYNSTGLKIVLQWLVWIIKTMEVISPRSSREDLTIDAQKENLEKIRKCFR